MTTLTEIEIQRFSDLRVQARLGNIGYWNIYQQLADLLVSKGVSATDQTLLWLRGAAEANAGRGAFSALIRGYTEAQYQIRYGAALPAGDLQRASNTIAESLLGDLLGESTGYPRGLVPDINRIAVADATAVGRVLFNRDPNDTAAELQQNSAWSGALLFTLLRSDQTSRLFSTGSSTSIDTLNDLRDVLYARQAYAAGIRNAIAVGASLLSISVTGSPEQRANAAQQLATDAVVLGSTLFGFVRNGSTDINGAVIAGTNNPTLRSAFNIIGNVNPNRFLDMLIGAAQGTSVVGATTEANFASRASAFFNAYGTVLQSTGAGFLPTTASGLSSAAASDVNARAALAALSLVSVSVSSDVAAQFSLLDPATGQGNITQEWITDRSAFTANYYAQQLRGGGILPGNQNLRYFDAASKTEVLVGAGSAQRVQYQFGGGGDDPLTGQGFADHLYGGAGKDTLSGLGGNDYLEGNSGADELDGGSGNDILRGGAGIDTYQFNSSFGQDTLTDSDGLGSILIDGLALGQTKAAGQRNVWSAELGAGSGQYVGLVLYNDARSSTGQRLVIARAGSPDNTITINNFSLAQAQSAGGYLGIKFDPTRQLALQEGVGENPYTNPNFNPASLNGKTATLAEGSGRSFTVYFNQAAQAGDTLTLAVGQAASELQVLLNGGVQDANGAVITLTAGQTEASFALVQDGELQADVAGALSVSYMGAGQQNASSNSLTLTLTDSGESLNTFTGDQLVQTGISSGIVRERVYNTERVQVVPPGGVTYLSDGVNLITLGGDTLVTDNVLYGSNSNDRLNGLTGNDALSGNGGNDTIDGGSGDDLIGGGSGNDRILGGDGNDYISSSAVVTASQQRGPNDVWALYDQPPGTQLLTSGATWGIFIDPASPDVTIWSGISQTSTTVQSDVIDAGAGDDNVVASWGNDRVEGGKGDDRIAGLAGNDILEGGDGADDIDGDGRLRSGLLQTVQAEFHGSDFIDGGMGNDSLFGNGGADQLFGGADNDTIFGDSSVRTDNVEFIAFAFHGIDYLDGEGGDDYLEGGGREDTLYGGEGDDRLWGDTPVINLANPQDNALAWADDYLDGEAGNDYLVGGGRHDTLYGGGGNDNLYGDESSAALEIQFHGTDYLDGEDGDDYLEGGGKDDTLYGGAGNDSLVGDASNAVLGGADHGNDYLDGEGDNDYLEGGGKDDTLYGGAGNDTLYGDGQGTTLAVEFNGDDYLDGEDGDDTLVGGGGNDTLLGGDGNDFLSGDDSTSSQQPGEYAGDDDIDGGEGNDFVLGGNGNDRINGGAGDDNLYGGEGDDTIDGGDGNDFLAGGKGSNTLDGGVGDDGYIFASGDGFVTITDSSGINTLYLSGVRLEDIQFSLGSLLITTGTAGDEIHLEGFDPADAANTSPVQQIVFQDTGRLYSTAQLLEEIGFSLGGTAQADTITGTSLTDHINTLEGDDTVFALAGNDTVNAGAGDDYVDGGEGDDVLEGAEGDDFIEGGVGNDTLDGGAGMDTLQGGTGDDIYIIGNATQTIVEFVDEGVDVVQASVSAVLGDQVENLTLTGNLAIDGTGNALDNVLIGNAADNRLIGGAGNDQFNGGTGFDTLVGGIGNDTYFIGNSTQTVVELADEGIDTVETSTSVTLADFVENLTLTGTQAIDGTGNAQDNEIIGNDQGNTLLGLDGDDALFAQAGNDVVNAGAGDDYVDGSEGDDVLEGGAGNDFIEGAAGNDSLDGGTGFNALYGGAGDDAYYFSRGDGYTSITDTDGLNTLYLRPGIRPEDLRYSQGSLRISTSTANGTEIDEIALEGLDLADAGNTTPVQRIVFLENGQSVEAAQFLLQLSASLAGTPGPDEITGTPQDDVINTLGGDDAVFALAGNDVVNAGAGNDYVEGGEGNDTLDGGAGMDTLRGGDGNDTYIVRNETQTIVELADAGTDTVQASISVVLGNHLENLTLTGEQAINGTGNALANVLIGNASINALSGGAGNDQLNGGAGNDVLDGGAGADSLIGGDGDDSLDGGSGSDMLSGGAGDDAYYYSNRGNGYASITDTQGLNTLYLQPGIRLQDLRYSQGSLFIGTGTVDDEIRLEGLDPTNAQNTSPVQRIVFVDTDIAYDISELLQTLGVNLQGSPGPDNITGTPEDDFINSLEGDDRVDALAGNDVVNAGAGNDHVVGGVGNDTLDGGTGIDTLLGGIGDDTYIISNGTQTIVELADEGTDTVLTSISAALGSFVENLTLTGTQAIDGTGNALDNVLTGNAAVNTLRGGAGTDRLNGGAGDDVLDGGAGADVLAGGTGNDTYLVDESTDQISENLIRSMLRVTASAILEEYLQLGWTISSTPFLPNFTREPSGAGLIAPDVIGNLERARQEGYVITLAATGEVLSLPLVLSRIFINDVDAVVSETSYTLGNGVENLTLAGSANLNGSGNQASNVITGNAGNNVLVGSALNGQVDYEYGQLAAGIEFRPDGVNVFEPTNATQERLIDRFYRAEFEQRLTVFIDGIVDLNGRSLGFISPGIGDELYGGEGDDQLYGGLDNDVLDGGAGNDTLVSGGGADILRGGTGNDTYVLNNPGAIRIGRPVVYDDSASAAVEEAAHGGVDLVVSNRDYTLGDNVENLTLVSAIPAIYADPSEAFYYPQQLEETPLGYAAYGAGNALDNVITANDLGNTLVGLGGDDTLYGGRGNDTLDGGTGVDMLAGGEGDDTYLVDSIEDQVIDLFFEENRGNDTVITTLSAYTLGDNLDNLTLIGGTDAQGFGNALSNVITGNNYRNYLFGYDGNDILDGLGGDDVLDGGLGSDSYFVDSENDVVIETSGFDEDTVSSSAANFTLSERVENLGLFGEINGNGTGNELNNILGGDDSDNLLIGLDGFDNLIGGGGHDVLIGGNDGDRYLVNIRRGVDGAPGGLEDEVIEEAGQGFDSIILDVRYDANYNPIIRNLGPAQIDVPDYVENLDVSSFAGQLQISGNEESNTIASGTGRDNITGGAGDDVIYSDGFSSEQSTFINAQAATLLHGFLQNLIATTAPELLNLALLVSRFGVQRAFGDGAMPGHVRVQSELLANFSDSGEAITLYWPTDNLPTAVFDAAAVEFGSLYSDVVHGDAGNDYLDGGRGSDRIFGGDGDDQLYGGNPAFASVTSAFGAPQPSTQGQETYQTSLTGFTAPDEDDYLDGGEGNDFIDGQAGNDTILGGEGNDELYGGGLYVAYGYGSGGNENPTLQAILPDTTSSDVGSGAFSPQNSIPGDGTAGFFVRRYTDEDYIDGAAGDDIIDGRSGDDILLGGTGNDLIYGGDNEGVFDGADGTIIISSNDFLDGGEGIDSLIGGTGDDTYIVDGTFEVNPDGNIPALDLCDPTSRFGFDREPLRIWTTDSVTEYADDEFTTAGYENGNDTVYASASVVLDNVETVVLQETAAIKDIDATTGAGSQELIGNSGSNRLDGGAGADLLRGGAGDDTYIVDDAQDQVVELASQGTDTVRSSLDSYTLAADLENLILEGTAITAIGNAANNILIGNNQANLIDGAGGDDVLAGWRGNDTLRGGAGVDTYAFSRGDGVDTIIDAQGAGVVSFSEGITFNDLAFSREGNDLVIEVRENGLISGDRIVLTDWALNAERVNSLIFCDEDPVVLNESLLGGALQAVADSNQIVEDAANVSGNVLTNDGQPGQTLTVSNPGTYAGRYGSLVLGSNGSYTYQLNNALAEVQSLAVGSVLNEVFNYSLQNTAANPATASSTLSITITGSNDAPVTTADVASVQEDLALTASGNVLTNDRDVDTGDTLTLSSASTIAGVYGSLTLEADGDYSYSLNNTSAAVQALRGGQQVTDSFTYSATDTRASTDGSLVVTVLGRNDAPIALADTATIAEDTLVAVTGNVLSNDSDVDQGSVLRVISAGTLQGKWGELTLNANGSYSYTLNNTAAGVQALNTGEVLLEAFTYTVADDATTNPLSASSTLTITITGNNEAPVNQAPIAVVDTATVAEDGMARATGNVLANDSDPNVGNTLTVSTIGNRVGTYGSLSLAANGAYDYNLNNASTAVQSLAAGQSASEVFNYTVQDSDATPLSATSQVRITVNGANDAPIVVTAIADQSGREGQAFNYVVAANAFSDIDQGDVLRYSAQLINSHGTAVALPSWLGFNATTRTFSGTPTSTASGAYSLRVTATDIVGASASDTFALNVANAVSHDDDDDDDDRDDDDRDDDDRDDDDRDDDDRDDDDRDDDDRDDDDRDDDDRDDDDRDDDDRDDDDRDDDDDDRDHDDDDDDDDDHHQDNNNPITGRDNREDNLSGGSGNDTLAFGDDGTWRSSGSNTVITVNVGSPGVAGSNVQVSLDRLERSLDFFNGGAGIDTLVGTHEDDAILLEDPNASSNSNARISNIEIIDGGWGNDVIDLTSIRFAYGNVTLIGNRGDDTLWASAGNDVLQGGDDNDTLDGGAGNDLLQGGEDDDRINGTGLGNDVSQGQDGNDTLTDSVGTNLLDGGDGRDTLTDGDGGSLLLGGDDDDTLNTGRGADLIAFNRGDGEDTVYLGAESSANDVLSLGRGIRYADIRLQKANNDLVIELGGDDDQITLKNWYADANNRTVNRLQVVTVGGDYNASSSDTLRNRQVQVFDFARLVQSFDTARAANASNGNGWSVMNSLLNAHLQGGNTQALGGDLSFQYATTGSLAGIGLGAAQASLAAGASLQTLSSRSQLEQGSVRLAG